MTQPKISTAITLTQEEEFNIPLCIDDIINICREFNKLGWALQNQVETIIEMGVEEAINSKKVKYSSLAHIKDFLLAICKNELFGDAASQSQDCIQLINQYQDTHQIISVLN
jgi:hypothetical protein